MMRRRFNLAIRLYILLTSLSEKEASLEKIPLTMVRGSGLKFIGDILTGRADGDSERVPAIYWVD